MRCHGPVKPFFARFQGPTAFWLSSSETASVLFLDMSGQVTLGDPVRVRDWPGPLGTAAALRRVCISGFTD
jgi:hypothetical protein